MTRRESIRLREVWEMRNRAYREVCRAATVEQMVAKRIDICNKSAAGAKLKKSPR